MGLAVNAEAHSTVCLLLERRGGGDWSQNGGKRAELGKCHALGRAGMLTTSRNVHLMHLKLREKLSICNSVVQHTHGKKRGAVGNSCRQ